MKEFSVFVLLVLAARQINSIEVQCESKGYYGYALFGRARTCYMRSATVIDSNGITISSRDETVGGLQMQGNKKIRFLPVKLAETFPNLLAYYAKECSLTEISKKHFEKLSKLRIIALWENEIVKISSNTFEDLTSLEALELQHNKIKFINGDAFQKLNKLTDVHLNGNICIDESFDDPTRIAAMPQIITNKCGYDESSCWNGVEQGICQSEINAKAVEIARLKAELADASDSKCHCNNQMFLAELQAKNSEIKILKERIQTFPKFPTCP